MRSMFAAATIAALCAGSAALHAANGIIVTITTTRNGNAGTNKVEIDPNHMRAESTDSKGVKDIFIFDGARQVMEMVHPDRKAYTEITKEDVDRLGGQMSAAMQQMQAQMANLPPEQRARIEAMMKGRMGGPGGASPSKPAYTKVGTDKVGKWTCDKYRETSGGAEASEVCTVSPQELGLTADDFAVTKQMAAFASRIIPQQRSQQIFTIGSVEQQGYPGIPVRRTSTIGGVTNVTEVTDVSRGSIPDSAFQVPADYHKEPMMGVSKGK
jgi:hypothetical protein